MPRVDEDTLAAIARFLRDAASTASRSGAVPSAFAEIGDGLRGLAQLPDIIDEGAVARLHRSAAAGTIIGQHPNGSVLTLARFAAEEPTPVHNHNSWGVACVLRGRDRYQRWERLDDGSVPDHSDVRLIEELTLMLGDVVAIDQPPQDLHAQQGIDGAVWELVYFGADAFAAPRAYFDTATGAVTYRSAV